MDATELAVVGAAFLFAAFVKGTTGLGFSTTCLPFLVLAVGLKPALPLLIIPSLSSNLLVMIDAGHFRATVRRFWPLYVASLPGIALGLAILSWVDPRGAAAVLGVVLIAYSLFSLGRPHVGLAARTARALAAPTGFLTGMVNGLTGSQVMPVLPYLLALGLEPNRFVQAINCSFTLCSLAMAIGLTQIGLMTVQAATVSILGLVPVYIGIKLGNRVRRLLSPDGFRRAVLVLLLLLGLGLLLRPVL